MAGLFDKLPFQQAIDAFADRLALRKDPNNPDRDEFLKLDAANRSRAFTMAWVSDRALLQNIHDELLIALNDGDGYQGFRARLTDLQGRSGWTGTSPWHYRLVYDMNMGMAYAAGRVQQGQSSGLRVWRYTRSLSDNPRSSHAQYYGNLYRMAPGTPVPPIDFNCLCGWEWVMPEELDALGIDPATLPTFNPPMPESGFIWSATDYFDGFATHLANAASRSRWQDGMGLVRVVNAVTDAAPNLIRTWFDLAVAAAGEIGERKFRNLLAYFDGINSLTGIAVAFDARSLIPQVLQSPDEIELNHQVTFAALLKGRVDVKEIIDAKG